jgi:hypothetical protein
MSLVNFNVETTICYSAADDPGNTRAEKTLTAKLRPPARRNAE